MKAGIEIARFDYVKQSDGTWDWAVTVRAVLADPHSDTGSSVTHYGPMEPAEAERRFGLVLSDVLDGLNKAAVVTVTDARAEATAARATLTTEITARVRAEDLVNSAAKINTALHETLEKEKSEHNEARQSLADAQKQLAIFRDALLVRAADKEAQP